MKVTVIPFVIGARSTVTSMSEKKTTLTFLRKQDWKRVKIETGKMNKLLTHISTNSITELNELVYAGAK